MCAPSPMQQSFSIKSLTIPHRLVLAPLCGITLKPFRLLCKSYGAGLVFNQMVSAKALTMNCQKTFKLLDFDESERPIAMQIFGNDAHVLAQGAQMIEERTHCDVLDLNVGCPAHKIVKDGGGSMLMTDEKKLREILTAMRAVIKGIFTIKIRAGWDKDSLNAMTVAKLAEDCGVDAITVHGRTRSQGYSQTSDWSVIKEIKAALKIPVIGNGDVKVASDAYRMMEETGCDAVMVGRAAFHKPWIFSDFINKTNTQLSNIEMRDMILTHYRLMFVDLGESTAIKLMRKIICGYSKGIQGGSDFRNRIVRLNDWNEIQKAIGDFFAISTIIS